MPRSETEKDLPAFHVIPARDPSRLVVICDHASAFMPECYGGLGLAAGDRYSHIAWDPGAEAVARRLGARLNAAVVLAGASRLLVDCNRAEDDAGWMPAWSCGIEVPGNCGLSADEKAERKRVWYDPYHQAIAEQVRRIADRGQVPALIAVHSFTPCLGAEPRPWHVGVLWNRDGRLALPALDRLRREPGVAVGDNQPYSAREINYTLDTHAGRTGIPHVSFEIRQDLLADDDGVERWGELLGRALEPSLTDEGLYRVDFSLSPA